GDEQSRLHPKAHSPYRRSKRHNRQLTDAIVAPWQVASRFGDDLIRSGQSTCQAPSASSCRIRVVTSSRPALAELLSPCVRSSDVGKGHLRPVGEGETVEFRLVFSVRTRVFR